MIDPFEFEKTIHEVKTKGVSVKSSQLYSSHQDTNLRKLENFEKKHPAVTFAEEHKPFSMAFHDKVGRVPQRDDVKALYQEEALAQKGSLVDEYDVATNGSALDREAASVILSRYLDDRVDYVLPIQDVAGNVRNMKADRPALYPGITSVDSRKNMVNNLVM